MNLEYYVDLNLMVSAFYSYFIMKSLITVIIGLGNGLVLYRQHTFPKITMTLNLLTHSIIIVNPLRPRQNGRHFADDIFKCIFLNQNVWILIKISLKFFPKGPINNTPALVQIMAWRRPGDKPLSEPMMVRLPTHICVTRPQWVNVL